MQHDKLRDTANGVRSNEKKEEEFRKICVILETDENLDDMTLAKDNQYQLRGTMMRLVIYQKVSKRKMEYHQS